jgi:hypothetical protein
MVHLDRVKIVESRARVHILAFKSFRPDFFDLLRKTVEIVPIILRQQCTLGNICTRILLHNLNKESNGLWLT